MSMFLMILQNMKRMASRLVQESAFVPSEFPDDDTLRLQ